MLAVAAATMGVLLLFSGRYGYHGDELYFVAAGHHLDWGYADQPPLLPLIALLMDTLWPDSVIGLRLPAILLTGLGVVISALIARELRGDRWAQSMTAGAYACSPFLLAGAGHILATHMVDAFLWTLLSWLLVRWVRTRDDRLLLATGVVTALALQVKFLIPVFWLAVAVTVLAFGPRDLLRRPKLWIGAGIAVLATVPTVLWQINHGWPQLEMDSIVAEEVSFAGGRLTFVPFALEQAGLIVGALLLLYGVWRLLRSAELRPYRFLGWTVLLVTVVFWVNSGRPYYLGGLFALCWAAGSSELRRRIRHGWWGWKLAFPAYALSAVLAVQGLPVTPIGDHANRPYSPMNMELEEFGWPELVEDVAKAYHSLPDPGDTTILTESYWQAAAIDQFGPAHGLPEAYSGARGYWYFGEPPESAGTTLVVGYPPERLSQYFADVRLVGKVDNGHAVNNANQGMPIWAATGRRDTWARLWPELRHMRFMA